MHSNTLISTLGLISLASAHGIVTSPPVRAAGKFMTDACGSGVSSQVVADPTSHVEGLPEAAAVTANFNATACNVFLCKGLQFEDNIANVQKFTPGQVVNIKADITIPHEGPANVSVVNTATNKIIGKPLITFASYADEALNSLPANNTNFNVTMPKDLGTACTVAGACVVQWFWFGTGAAQTYESCVDFTMSAVAKVAAGTNGTVKAPTGGNVAKAADSCAA